MKKLILLILLTENINLLTVEVENSNSNKRVDTVKVNPRLRKLATLNDGPFASWTVYQSPDNVFTGEILSPDKTEIRSIIILSASQSNYLTSVKRTDPKGNSYTIYFFNEGQENPQRINAKAFTTAQHNYVGTIKGENGEDLILFTS